LHPLTSRINALIASERGRQKRYRHTLDDLAHSLKTPLSVLRNLSATGDEIEKQSDRMQEIIAYHIKRADAGTKRILTKPMALRPPIDRVSATLKKVYRDRNITFKNHIEINHNVRMEEADLLELFGNLLENACKYGAQTIELGSENVDGHLQVDIDDDGPGFAAQARDGVLDRGVRADSRQEGQGLGLAITKELLANYGGTITLLESPAGGARVRLKLPLAAS